MFDKTSRHEGQVVLRSVSVKNTYASDTILHSRGIYFFAKRLSIDKTLYKQI